MKSKVANSLVVGDVVSIRFGPFGVLKHVGVVYGACARAGQSLIAHNSKKHGKVCIHTLREFSEGKPISKQKLPHSQTDQQIQEHVDALKGKSYRLFSANCENFVRQVLGLKIRSPQLEGWAFAGLAVAVILVNRGKSA